MSAETAPSSADIMAEAFGAGIEPAAEPTPAPETPAAAPSGGQPTPEASTPSSPPSDKGTPSPAAGSTPDASDETPAPAPATAPAAAQPWRRTFKAKIDGREEDIDADEATVVAALQAHRALPQVRFREQLAGAQWFVEQLRAKGTDAELWLNPATNLYEARVKQPNTTAAATPSAPETTDEELLEQAAAELGVAKDSPLVKLHQRQLKRMREEQLERERRDEESRKTTALQRQQREDEETARQAGEFFTKNAKAYEGERGSRAQLVTRAALFGMENMPPAAFANYARLFGLATDGAQARRREECFRIAETFTRDREVEWGERLKAALPQVNPAPTPPPVVGTGSAAPAKPTEKPLSIGDPDFDQEFAERVLSRSAG